LVLTLPSCGKKKDDTKAPDKKTVAGKTTIEERLDASPALKKHMKGHFEAVREIERALVAGDLTKAKERSEWLSDNVAQKDIEDWGPHLDAVRNAAKALVDSETIEDATKRAAQLGAECANCHVTLTAITSFEWQELPRDQGEARSNMQRHQWATDRLWEGLVGPSDDLWLKGAEVLIDAPLGIKTLTKDQKVASDVDAYAAKVHGLGSKAQGLMDRSARTELYGELLATCSACHALTRKK
jgi:hypothetical protein